MSRLHSQLFEITCNYSLMLSQQRKRMNGRQRKAQKARKLARMVWATLLFVHTTGGSLAFLSSLTLVLSHKQAAADNVLAGPSSSQSAAAPTVSPAWLTLTVRRTAAPQMPHAHFPSENTRRSLSTTFLPRLLQRFSTLSQLMKSCPQLSSAPSGATFCSGAARSRVAPSGRRGSA